MNRLSNRRRPLAAVVVLAIPIAFLPGCLNDDDPGDSTVEEAEDAVAAQLGENIVELDQMLAEQMPAVMAGEVGPSLREESVTWDPVAQEWHISFSEDYDDSEASGHIEITQRIQLLSDGVPVQYPAEGADEAHVVIEGSNEGNYHPGGDYEVDFDLALERSIVAVRSEDGSFSWDGEGTFSGATTYHVGDRDYPRQATVTWSSDLTWAAGSTCAAGTLSGTNGPATVTATFDGAGGVSWQVVRGGAVLGSGADEYACTESPAR
jgi:hypothetical protein